MSTVAKEINAAKEPKQSIWKGVKRVRISDFVIAFVILKHRKMVARYQDNSSELIHEVLQSLQLRTDRVPARQLLKGR